MKTHLLTLTLLLAAVAAFSQGKVTFGNDSSRLFVIGYPYIPGDSDGPVPPGPLPNGNIIQAMLYAGTSASSLTLQTAVSLIGSDWLAPGRMANKPLVLNGVPGGATAYFQIFLADTGGVMPATIVGNQTLVYDFWASGGSYFGTSGLFTAVPGISISYPLLIQTSPPVSSTWQPGFIYAVIPEPSTLTLVGFGLVALLAGRCRK